jgi:magnesium-protoporphyrin O-methyltransferase
MFSTHAARYARKFRRNGLDRPQRMILRELEIGGVEGKTILEVGCGVGGLHLTLLMKGANSALGNDLSNGMIEEAMKLSKEFGVDERVSYRLGDLVTGNGSIPQRDIVILDKVLCCYADPAKLIEISAAKAVELYAVSYPRESWLAAVGFGFVQWMGTLLRWSFHPYYHKPDWLERLIRNQGLTEIGSATTPIWQIKLFRRVGTAEREG